MHGRITTTFAVVKPAAKPATVVSERSQSEQSKAETPLVSICC